MAPFRHRGPSRHVALVHMSAPPRVESLSYVGGDRQRQDVADELEVLRVAHTFTLPRARRKSRASPVNK